MRDAVQFREENGLLAFIERRQISKYCHWNRRPNSLVMVTVEGEVNGKARRGRRKTGWIENVRRMAGSMTAAKAQVWKGSGNGSTMV